MTQMFDRSLGRGGHLNVAAHDKAPPTHSAARVISPMQVTGSDLGYTHHSVTSLA